MARNATRLYMITLRAASRRVGDSRLVRGNSFTLPLDADVSGFKRLPKVWDVKIIPGHAPRQPVDYGSRGAPPVSVRSSSALTGLVNRLDAAAASVVRLDAPGELEGFRHLVRAQAGHLAPRLARVFGGEPETWMGAIEAGDDLVDALELLDAVKAGDSEAFRHVMIRVAPELVAEAEADVEDDDARAAELAARAAEAPRGADADEDDEDAEAEASEGADADEDPQEPDVEPAAENTKAGEVLEPANGSGASPHALEAPQADAQALEAFQAGLVALQAGDEGFTMAQVLDLAAAAGLEVPPVVRKIRRRAELAAELAALLAAKATAPTPSELEG